METKHKKQLGNPMLAMTAAQAATPMVQAFTDDLIEQRRYRREYERTHAVTTRKVIKWTALAAIAGYLGYCGYRGIRRNQLKKQALSDPNVAAAVKIWNAIPAGMKNDFSPWWWLTPWKSVSIMADKVSLLWSSDNYDALCTIAQTIHNNPNADPEKISAYFYTLYGAALPDILSQAMGNNKYTAFSNIVVNGSTSSVPTIQPTNPQTGENHYCVTKLQCNVREEPDRPTYHLFGRAVDDPFHNNVIATAQPNTIVGRFNGLDQHDAGDDINYTQISMLKIENGNLAIDPTRVAWVAKSQIYNEAMTVNDVKNRFGNVNALVSNSDGSTQLTQIG